MAKTYRTVYSQKLDRWNLFIYIKGVHFLLEKSDKQFSTQASSVDDYSVTISQQHNNQGEVNNSPVEIKLSAHSFLFCSVFRFSCARSDSLSPSLVEFFLSSFLTLLPDQRWKFTQRESLFPSLSPPRVFTPSSSVLPSFPQRCADSLQETITSKKKDVSARSNCLFAAMEAELLLTDIRLTWCINCCMLQLFF